MLLRLITAISLLVFALLMMSGSKIDLALYRSLIVFLILFAGVYLTMFFINILQQTPRTKASSSTTSGKGSTAGDTKKTKND
ncbi:hypothetical protein QLX67_11110 [Balneolaceae bacterium ANBcel3]|nr:hypothetical protein [Balneolaceae bacterium ANBcel3]